MLIIKNGKNDNIERMLKKFKQKVDKTGMIRELRERQQFTKKSVKNRKVKNKAIYIEKKYGNQ